MQRTAQAEWKGTGREGSGTLTTPSGVLNAQPYSFKLRFQDEDGRNGTNPEELIAAAHAGCFSMALSFQLANAGFTADAAFANRREGEIGRLAEGYRADFVVLDADPAAIDAAAVPTLVVRSTWVDGEPVYTRTADSATTP